MAPTFTQRNVLRVIALFGCFATWASAQSAPRVYRDRLEPHWISGTARFWYRNALADGKSEFVLVDAQKGTRAPAFDQARLADALAKASGKEVSADKLPISGLEFDGDGAIVLRGAAGSWRLDLKTYEVTKDSTSEETKTLSAQQQARPSRPGGNESEIEFVNETNQPVELFWIDTEGSRRSYGTIATGERRKQHTFERHVWIAVQRDDATPLVFVATDKPAVAVIGQQASQRPARNRESRRNRRAVRSPDGKWEAFVRDHNLCLRDTASGEERALTANGSSADTYHRDVYRDRAIGLNYEAPEAPAEAPEVYWSPDSSALVAMRTHTVAGRTVYFVESSPADQLQPKLQSYPYLKPGDEIPVRKPHLFSVKNSAEIAVSDSLFSNPWDNTDLRWAADSGSFTFLFNQRGHQALRIIRVDAQTGQASAIVDEHSDTFIDYSGKMFVEYLDDTGEIIWASERDGWNHLYLYDARTGRIKNQITTGAWLVRGVDRVDAQKRQVWFRAGGIRSGQDPYFIHYCRVNFDGSGLVILTAGNGSHAADFSPDRRWLIDTFSRPDAPPIIELRRSDDGSLVCKLEEADASEVTSARRRFPEPFVAKGRDGVIDIYGVIYRPSNFDENKKYPVIENIYAGPQSSFVQKSFRATPGQQRLADLGFIVVQIDGMGTSNRSKKFHDVCWKNLGDGGFPDRILWIKSAAAKYPQFDPARVGIYGTSAGGQNALRGLLAHGDFYAAGVADSGSHDNRMDKIWWNEQWMGYPVGEEYRDQSNVTQAHRLKGKLLLMVGERDKNVDPSTTMQVVNALIKANKDFDLLVMPGAGHGVARTPYGQRRLEEFFVKNLLAERKSE